MGNANPWQYINENSRWASEGKDAAYISLTRDIYQTVLAIGIGFIALSAVLLFLRWALYRQQGGAVNRRNTLVGPLLFKLLLVVMITCLPYLIGEVYRIVNTVAKALTG